MKILMVEDEYLVAEEIRFCLSSAGFADIQHAATEEAALRCIAEELWDAAVVDANLNGRRLDKVAQSLASRGIPFVVVTGYGRGNLPDAFARVPVVDKPFRPGLLVNAVSGLVAHTRSS